MIAGRADDRFEPLIRVKSLPPFALCFQCSLVTVSLQPRSSPPHVVRLLADGAHRLFHPHQLCLVHTCLTHPFLQLRLVSARPPLIFLLQSFDQRVLESEQVFHRIHDSVHAEERSNGSAGRGEQAQAAKETEATSASPCSELVPTCASASSARLSFNATHGLLSLLLMDMSEWSR